MTADEFRARLREQRISQNLFATITGANPRTVVRWAHGEQDIPRWVALVLHLLNLAVPPGMDGEARRHCRLAEIAEQAGVFDV